MAKFMLTYQRVNIERCEVVVDASSLEEALNSSLIRLIDGWEPDPSPPTLLYVDELQAAGPNHMAFYYEYPGGFRWALGRRLFGKAL